MGLPSSSIVGVPEKNTEGHILALQSSPKRHPDSIMTPNLRELHIESLEVIGNLECGDEQAAALTERVQLYQKGWPRYRFERSGQQSRNGYIRNIDLSIIPDKTGHHPVRLSARPAPSRRSATKPSKAFREMLSVLDIIETLGVEATVHAHVNWEYERGTFETLINLPTFRTSGEMPFDYISGLRFVKRTGPEHTAVILDIRRSGGLLATAQMHLEDHRLSLDSLDDVIYGATSLIQDFVKERK